MKLFVLSFDFHSFLKKDIPDVIPISTFVHFSLVVISLKHRANRCSIVSCCICFCVAKSLSGFKLCTTSPNNMHQHAMKVCKQTQHAPGAGDSAYERGEGMLVSLRGINFGFWSHLERSGQNAIIFSHEGLV